MASGLAGYFFGESLLKKVMPRVETPLFGIIHPKMNSVFKLLGHYSFYALF